jgi:hypothetical protein
MKVVLERLEYSWWNFHIRLVDESNWVRLILPKVKWMWERREEAVPYLVLSILGFPIGVLVGWLTIYFK